MYPHQALLNSTVKAGGNPRYYNKSYESYVLHIYNPAVSHVPILSSVSDTPCAPEYVHESTYNCQYIVTRNVKLLFDMDVFLMRISLRIILILHWSVNTILL